MRKEYEILAGKSWQKTVWSRWVVNIVWKMRLLEL